MNEGNRNYDAIVVGTGPGGATVAKELSCGKKNVLMLEWGDNAPVTGGFWQEARAISTPGKNILVTKERLPVIRGVSTGGSSMLFYATCFPVPFEMFRSRGVDLVEFFEEATKELPVGTLKDEMMGPMSLKIMESARDLGYDWKKIDKFMHQDKWRPGNKFGYFGDINGVKWTSREYVEKALSNKATLIDRAKVKKVIVEGKKAKGVEYVKDGKTEVAYADKIIISAGGLGTPLILRESGIKNAGYNFFFDPLIVARGTLDGINVPRSEVPMSAGMHFSKEGYVMTDITEPYAISIVNSLMRFKLAQLFKDKKTLKVMVKIRDDLAGKLDDSGNIVKALTRDDNHKLDSGYEVAVKILKRAGAKNIHKTAVAAAHPGGTAKIGEVVDSDLKTEYDNLYVCDCSVIPEPWGLPPTATIICLGKRLGKHLLSL
jgi:choline dehydrogenase-like flavoprotein